MFLFSSRSLKIPRVHQPHILHRFPALADLDFDTGTAGLVSSTTNADPSINHPLKNFHSNGFIKFTKLKWLIRNSPSLRFLKVRDIVMDRGSEADQLISGLRASHLKSLKILRFSSISNESASTLLPKICPKLVDLEINF